MLALEQEDKFSRCDSKNEIFSIGVIIYKTEENRIYRLHRFPEELMDVVDCRPNRSTFHKMSLSKGRYVIIPVTEEPDQLAEFLLRVYTGNTKVKYVPIFYWCKFKRISRSKYFSIFMTILSTWGISLPQLQVFGYFSMLSSKCSFKTSPDLRVVATKSCMVY